MPTNGGVGMHPATEMQPPHPHRHKHPWWRRHTLSLSAAAVVALWIILYSISNTGTHLGSFFGNAIADWSGVVVMVLATKVLYERGSVESRQPPNELLSPFLTILRDHSLTIFLVLTLVAWAILYAQMNSETKWGTVVGNIVSEWTQIIGVVLMTKRLVETHSKESRK